ncbi:hypothetical protein H632_c3170p0, partial [Helicosporidium sp. ATCC 50920]
AGSASASEMGEQDAAQAAMALAEEESVASDDERLLAHFRARIATRERAVADGAGFLEGLLDETAA